MALTPRTDLDLDDWKLQLPVDGDGGFNGRYAEVRDLEDYASPYFRAGPEGGKALSAPVNGVTTGGSSYARTELRELASSTNAAWSLEDGGFLGVTMQVDEVPKMFDGSDAKIVIGQIHGGDHQLVRLYYDDGTVYWVNGRNEAQARDSLHQLRDAQGRLPQIGLDETFRYSFDVQGDSLEVALQADGTTYSSGIDIGPGWDDNRFYFKAGLYLGTNEATSRGSGQVSLIDVDLRHDRDRQGAEDPPKVDANRDAPRATPDPAAAPGSATFAGTNQSDMITGTAGAETILGRNSNDEIDGLGGRDKLVGGSGSDTFRMSVVGDGVDLIVDWEAKDQFALDARAFSSLADGVDRGNLVAGPEALDHDDHLVFVRSTGRISYDADGSGPAAAVAFAQLASGSLVTSSDFDIL